MTEAEHRMLNRLESGARTYVCGGYLTDLDPPIRSQLCTRLEFERLQGKCDRVKSLYNRTQDWNQTFYRMLFRTLGDATNQTAFETLADRVVYAVVLRERSSLHNVEALLLGASGLLELYPDDEYTGALRRDFQHYSSKYAIEAMDAGEWVLGRIKPLNHPVLRLSQLAVFLTRHELVFREALECRSGDDLQRLFGVEAPEYWRTRFLPGPGGAELPKRIGRTKTDLLGINLVSIMQYAYGQYVCHDDLYQRALELLEALPPEENRYIRHWMDYGLRPHNAFESQALLQLAREYCEKKRCRECPVGRRRLLSVKNYAQEG